MTSIFLLILLIILVILSGFLSGSETAITATSKARILYKKKKGSKRAGYVLELLDKKDNVISTLLLSNNLVNILASSLATAFFYDLFGVEGIFYATLIMTVVIVIFADAPASSVVVIVKAPCSATVRTAVSLVEPVIVITFPSIATSSTVNAVSVPTDVILVCAAPVTVAAVPLQLPVTLPVTTLLPVQKSDQDPHI